MCTSSFANVWEHSQHRGTALLLMMAIADSVADGEYGPTNIRNMAKAARIEEHEVPVWLSFLEESGELLIREADGQVEYRVFLKDAPPPTEWKGSIEPKRPKIPAAIRTEVFERDESTCQFCGSQDNLVLDHIKPWSLGGPDTAENLQVLCWSCNSKKGDQWPYERPGGNGTNVME